MISDHVDVTAAVVRVNAPITESTGIVKATKLQAGSVIASSYTPGVGNLY